MSSTVACRMALHDIPNPHLIDHENCLSWAMGSQTKEHKHLFNQTSRSIVSCKLIGRIHAGLRGEFLPILSDCSWRTYIQNHFKKTVQQQHPPAKKGLAIVKVAKSKHEGNIACNEAKCVAFMLYGNWYWWKASVQDMTGKHIASYRKCCSKKMNIMSDLQTSAEMK